MLKVSGIWRMLALFIFGVSVGVFLMFKIAPPSQDINIGRIKIKGKGHQIEQVLTVDKADTQDNSQDKSKKKFKLFRKNRDK